MQARLRNTASDGLFATHGQAPSTNGNRFAIGLLKIFAYSRSTVSLLGFWRSPERLGAANVSIDCVQGINFVVLMSVGSECVE